MKIFTVSLPNPARMNGSRFVRGFKSEEERNNWLWRVYEWNMEMTNTRFVGGSQNPTNPMGYELDDFEVFE